MNESNVGPSRRLARLERVLEGRRARLASALARPARRMAPATPLDGLRQYGYAVAVVIAATAMLPAFVGLAWRRRKLLVDVAANAWGVRKLRKAVRAAQPAERRR